MFTFTLFQNSVLALTLLLPIQTVTGSNLGQDSGYPKVFPCVCYLL
jgi:hypothetical protein